jgi:large subunit ribosomal protein L3
MNIAIVKKIKMTQLFDESGKQLPVTKVDVIPTKISDIRTAKKHGYRAIQLFATKENRKAEIKKEFRVVSDEKDLDFKKGQEFGIEKIKDSKKVSATGFTKGKGFQGSIKRHGFSRGPMSHGSHHKRKTGAIGQCVIPSKVFKGKKMPGRMGVKKITVKNLEVVKTDVDNNCIYLKGSLPGPSGSYLTLRGVS